jgi:hypothetical protein
MKGLLRILPALALVTVMLPGMEKKGSFDLTSTISVLAPTDDIVGQDVAEVYKKGSFDITELFGGKDPEDPVVTG